VTLILAVSTGDNLSLLPLNAVVGSCQKWSMEMIMSKSKPITLGVAIFYGGLIAGILGAADNITAYYFAAGCLNFVIHPAALTFSSYIFLTKRAGFAPGLLPTI
jgi:hypothetical protein